ncbi:hypothetical protein ACJJTC_013627 [Scirpophaga incertulas]
MVTRSLTDVYVLMRNNRQIFAEQNDSERSRLMHLNSRDMEMGMRSDTCVPPPWSDALDEVHYVITRLRTKLSELQARHERQIRRPALDDTSDQQHIGRLTAEIARHFTHAHTHITVIKSQCKHGNSTEQLLATNVVLALVTILRELSETFRSAQSNYLKSITSREERTKAYFDLPNFEELSLNDELLPSLSNNQTDLLFSLPSSSVKNINLDDDDQTDTQKQGLSQKQLMLMQVENTKMVAEREEEVHKIVRSIVDLNDIFKDVAHLVHEQGTVLDRIDYNIECTQVQVQEGYQQLRKAESYQKKNTKLQCILMLTVIVITLALLLIVVKA